jgi:hypothetical protein
MRGSGFDELCGLTINFHLVKDMFALMMLVLSAEFCSKDFKEKYRLGVTL